MTNKKGVGKHTHYLDLLLYETLPRKEGIIFRWFMVFVPQHFINITN